MSKRDINENYNGTNVRMNLIKKKLLKLVLSGLWFIWPSFVERIILKLFFSPSPYRLNDKEKDLIEQGESFYILSRGNRIKCWRWGKGPVILFGHGWNGRGIQFHHFITSIVNEGYTAVAYDAPAHGESEGQFSNYFDFTDALRAVYSALKQKDFHGIIAHSLGAAAAINMAEKEDYKGRLLLIASPLKLKELLFKTFDDFGIPKIIYQSLIQDLERNYEYNLHFDNPCQILKRYKNQIHIIHDTTDRMIPFEQAEKIADYYSHIQVHLTEGYGHRKILYQDAVINIILKILKQPEDELKSMQQAS